MLWNYLTCLFSPGGKNGNLSVLFFHRVVPVRDPLNPDEPTAEEFATMMGWLQRQFNVIPLSEGVRRLRDGSLPPAAAAITFDDGYRDNLEVAAPILQRLGLPATLFVATGFLDGGIMFNDVLIESIRRTVKESLEIPSLEIGKLPLGSLSERRQAISALLPAIKHMHPMKRQALVSEVAAQAGVSMPTDLMMTTAQVREFVGLGFETGAHTVTHPILSTLSDEDARREIAHSRSVLESITDKEVRLFAYPNGRWAQDFDLRHRDIARACGFDAAFSTEPGVSRQGADFWQLPRFTPWDRTSSRFALRMLSNCLAAHAARRD